MTNACKLFDADRFLLAAATLPAGCCAWVAAGNALALAPGCSRLAQSAAKIYCMPLTAVLSNLASMGMHWLLPMAVLAPELRLPLLPPLVLVAPAAGQVSCMQRTASKLN